MTADLLVTAGAGDAVLTAQRAEELGYGSIWLAELWGSAAPVTLGTIAATTDEIGLGTAILNVYSRSPAVLAMTAATLDNVSDGRFTLGVGTSTAKAVEDLHGMAFERPVRRAHETIELLRAFLEGSGAVSYDGELYSAADFPSLEREVPVYHAALGRANRRVAARLCDGWIPHNIPFSELPDAFEYLVEHLPGDRSRDDITVTPYVPSAVDEDPDAARDVIRGHVAYYVGSGEGYRRAVAERYPDEADRIHETWREGDRAAATAAVTDEMVADLGVAGTEETAREQLATLEEGVVDRPMVVIPANASDEVQDRTIEALAPDGG